MTRTFKISAAVSVLMLGLASGALAATGKYGNMDAMMLSQGTVMHTNCSIAAQFGGETYCFISQDSMQAFMQRPRRYARRADAAYLSLQ